MQKDTFCTRLKEGLDDAHDIRVVALGVARAKAVSTAPVSAPLAVIDQMRRTYAHEKLVGGADSAR
jgi:hypothetical protein